MSAPYRSSRPDAWTLPRPHTDASLRLQTNGKIQPMIYPREGFFAWLLNWSR